MAKAKSHVLHELYSGDKSWHEWIDHFESIVEVCDWDATKKYEFTSVLWLEPCLETYLKPLRAKECSQESFRAGEQEDPLPNTLANQI